MKRIAVLGTGKVGDVLADGFLKHGYEVMRGSRDPAKLEVSLYGFPADGERVKRARDAGADRVVFFAPPFGRDEGLKWLDSAAKL